MNESSDILTVNQSTGPDSSLAGEARVERRKARTADWVRLFRPTHWLKNLFVLGPVVFAGLALDPRAAAQAAAAFASFCLAASGIYALNDVFDREADRIHPVKRLRPVASGVISPRAALLAGAGLLIAGFAISWLAVPQAAPFIAIYAILNVAYTIRLKRVVVLDVFVIASFFILRLLVGAAAVSVKPSVWLLLCGGLLALYLGFTKRRHELTLLQGNSAEHRSVLSEYSAGFLDQMSTVLLAVTVVSYTMYTLESSTAVAGGSDALTYSTVFVLYGVFRYLYLVQHRAGGSPTETLLGDRQLLLVVASWVAYCAIVIYRAS